MLKSRSLAAILAVLVTLVATPSHAGSARWIMVMTPERMVQNKLVHVRFTRPDGAAFESHALKQMVIREQDCSSGPILEMVTDYKMGFEPENKLLGIYLLPQAWENKTLCFDFPGTGKTERKFSAADNGGRSIQLNVTP